MLILSPIPKQFLDESGVPYTDGTVSIYLHGDTEFAEVYADAKGTALIENPCILDSHGMWQGFVDSDKPLDYIVKDSEGNVITRFCNISLPTGDDIPGVKVISSDGSINVDETLENGERTFDITVNDDMFKPSCAKFSHEAVNGGGEVSFDSFELEGDPDRDIYLADGVITLAEGVYHISANFVIGNDECHNEYFGITVNFGDCSTAKVWDRSFVHEESVEFGLDIVADVDGYTVVPTIAELPDDMHCSISRLYIHKVSGAGVGGSMASVEHDGTLVGDGTHNDPLGVKDWSEIKSTLENTAEELSNHEVSHSAHQDIRDDIEYEANRAQTAEGLKADKVQGATAGNLAALDANGNLTDSSSKVADFKTKQTPVTDPSASGAGLEFIDSVSQDANGEITPHKKSVQDGTTAQKGVVQLQDSIGSTESATDKAVTPHAVREAINAAVSSAYHAAGTKTVAQLTSSLLVAENEGCVYNVTDSGTTTSDFVDGAGHPINAGDNVGVCDVGGGVYKFDLLSGFVDLSNYLTKTGDASNATSTFTKASGDTSTMASGGKLSAIFTAISSFFASLKALAFKDKVSDSDINGTISDSHIASASTWNGKQNSLGINTSSGDTGKFLNERGAFATPNYPSVPSVIDNLTSTSTTDALSAAQGKALNDGKQNNLPTSGTPSSTYAVNVSGTAKHLDCYGLWHTYGTGYYDSSKPYAIIGELNLNISGNTGAGQLLQFELDSGIYARVRLDIKWSNGSLQRANVLVIDSSVDYSTLKDWIKITHFTFTDSGNSFLCIRLYVKFTGDWQVWRVRQLDCQTGDCGFTNWADFPLRTGTKSQESSAYGTLATYKFCYPYANGQVGSSTTPVYVDSNGQVQPCDPSQMNVGSATNVGLSKVSNSISGDSIRAGNGTAVTIGNAGNAKKWDSWRIAVDDFGTNADTIYFY